MVHTLKVSDTLSQHRKQNSSPELYTELYILEQESIYITIICLRRLELSFHTNIFRHEQQAVHYVETQIQTLRNHKT